MKCRGEPTESAPRHLAWPKRIMNTIEIIKARREDFPAIARLMAGQNGIAEFQCIHSGEGYESILQTMVKWDEISEICFAIAVQNGHLVGVLGCEFDEELGRGWLWGPFVLTSAWEELAGALLEKLLALLPTAIRRLDFFLNQANQRAYRFYLEHGFREPKKSHVYVAPRPQAPPVFLEPCSPLPAAQSEPFRVLHDTIFPRTYYTGQDILDQLDDDHCVYVCAHGEDLLGYVYAILDESAEGYVEFLGVRADARGRGLGKRLLLTALNWLFEVKKVSEVGLTVSDEQINARSLYEMVGFRIRYTGVSAQKDW
jgi:GNAT superfamily N-acetyltransferase